MIWPFILGHGVRLCCSLSAQLHCWVKQLNITVFNTATHELILTSCMSMTPSIRWTLVGAPLQSGNVCFSSDSQTIPVYFVRLVLTCLPSSRGLFVCGCCHKTCVCLSGTGKKRPSRRRSISATDKKLLSMCISVFLNYYKWVENIN